MQQNRRCQFLNSAMHPSPFIQSQHLYRCSLQGDGDKEYTELIGDDQRPQRQRPPITRLLSFALGVAFMNVPLLVAAYSLLLLAMVFRLAVPKVEGAIFDAFNSFDMPGFRWAGKSFLILSLKVWLLAAVCLIACKVYVQTAVCVDCWK
jgi:hypothetical protein